VNRADVAAMKNPIVRLVLLLLVTVATAPACAREQPGQVDRVEVVRIGELPREARDTLQLIKMGGPFPYRKDGVAFQNRERRLPLRERGYYREYTVPTPGSADRGARRIVAGRGDSGDVRTSGEYYYTGDHYRTFRRIAE